MKRRALRLPAALATEEIAQEAGQLSISLQ